MRRGRCKLWSKRFANDKIALLSIEIHKCVRADVHNLVEVLQAGKLGEVLNEIVTHSKVEFNYRQSDPEAVEDDAEDSEA